MKASTLIVVPQDNEFVPLLEGFTALGLKLAPGKVGRIRVGSVNDLDLVVAVCGHGKTQTALQCQYLIDRIPGVARLICAGAAGSLSDLVKFGDVVVGTVSVEHDYKLRFVEPSLPVHPAYPVLLARVQKALTGLATPFEVHFGPIASGDEDVVDRMRAEEIRAETDALCVAWEGSGAARAAAFNGLEFVEMRVITDAADLDAKRSFDENLQLVMSNLAVLVTRFAKGLAFAADAKPH